MDNSSSLNNKKYGRYVLGGTTEVSAYALEFWERSLLPRDPTDIVYIMEKKYEGRPDLLGVLFYSDPGLWWIIAQFNGLTDPLEELIEGKLLYIPMLDRVRSEMFSESKGPVATTRGA